MTRYLPKKENFSRRENVGSINFKLQASNAPVLSANTPWSSSMLQRISSGTFQSRGTRARKGHCRWTGLAQVRTWSNGNYVDWKANTSVVCVSGKAETPVVRRTHPYRPKKRRSRNENTFIKTFTSDISKSCYFLDQKAPYISGEFFEVVKEL